MKLNIISNIGYTIACLVFGYVILGVSIEAFKTKNKWFLVSILLMLSVIAITVSEII